jgi:hypothetical protein
LALVTRPKRKRSVTADPVTAKFIARESIAGDRAGIGDDIFEDKVGARIHASSRDLCQRVHV